MAKKGTVTLPQAEAFMKAVLKNPVVTAHFEAILGCGNVAKVTDFDSQEASALDRAEPTLRHVDACCGALWKAMVGRPRQHELDFDGDKKAAAEKDEKKRKGKKGKTKAEREAALKEKLGGTADDAIDAAKEEGAERTGGPSLVPEDDEDPDAVPEPEAVPVPDDFGPDPDGAEPEAETVDPDGLPDKF